jgi:lipopolysaccharide transport system ATP-binding protein
MSDVAISVENISKCYRIGTQGGPAYHRFTEMMTGVPRELWNAGKSLIRKRSAAVSTNTEAQNDGEFWALKDVNFEVKQGEVVGIIGRNGAGKSTLLKILSRITEPTSGRFGVKGRVASLLEVGTGFHPELTGRENIYVSGITLGMTRAEIKKRFDEIVDFSGVEKFLDTPVKNYSSGMQVRLGFAVAAHLESEILIVDEVLAVGDAEFQKKCLGKMELAALTGRTIVFVSHNLAAMEKLCSHGILFCNGVKTFDGSIVQALSDYCGQSAVVSSGTVRFSNATRRLGPSEFSLIRAITLVDRNGDSTGFIRMGDTVSIKLEIELKAPIHGPEIGVVISTRDGSRVTRFISLWESETHAVGKGIHIYEIRVDKILLVPGVYTLSPWVKRVKESVDDMIEGELIFEVLSNDVSGFSPYFERYCKPGEVYTPSNWSVVKVSG